MIEDSLILAQSEYARLLEEIHKLQARITELTALRDDLVYHVCPALRAEYDEKIVSLERELMAANMYLRQLQRTIEILQAQMNQQQEPSMEKAEAQAKQENKEYEEDLHRKAEEAREFKKQWEQTQWSQHDQQDRETRKQEQKRTERSAGFSSDEDAEGDRKEPGGSAEQSESEETIAQKIKQLYRKIVKRLHPDVHPNPTEHEKGLLNQAMKAFREGDLKELERIWDELSGMDAPEDMFDDTPEGREKLRELLEKLKVRLRLLELEIEHIRTEFPYKLKQFLEDPVAVEEVRRGIQSRIDNVREMTRQLEAFINEMKEKIRKGEKP